jgi:hypothetical protein
MSESGRIGGPLGNRCLISVNSMRDGYAVGEGDGDTAMCTALLLYDIFLHESSCVRWYTPDSCEGVNLNDI